MDSIEAAPFENLSEDQAERLLQHYYNIEKLLTGGTAIAIIMIIARHTAILGEARISHKTFQQYFGVCRRTVDNAMKQLRKHNLIERIGTDTRGFAIYRANLPV
ncbi:hypothetical protein [Pseudochrobactrum sp. MP213Fo]|uniref:hypothetical protein n=1 Tax=Pseudochrobactrum sp. MP213Fo TaxID=3022250 RepID=UPI003B9DFAB3